jgi:hypothetical protein
MEIVVDQATPFDPNLLLFLFCLPPHTPYSFGKSRAEFKNLESRSVEWPVCRRIRGRGVTFGRKTGNRR